LDAALPFHQQQLEHYVANVQDDAQFQSDDGFQGFLPPLSPSLGSASMEMSEPDTIGLNVQISIIDDNRDLGNDTIVPAINTEPRNLTLVDKIAFD
jgi:hypothetical protein